MEDEAKGFYLLSPFHASPPVEDGATSEQSTSPPSDGTVLSSAVVEDMPLVQTTPRCRVMAYRPSAAASCGRAGPLQRSLHGTVGLGLVTTPTATAEETRALLHSFMFFPEGDPEFGAPEFVTIPDQPHAVAEEEEEVGRPEEKKDEEEHHPGVSVEVQIGQKLREIGDQFHEEHLQLFLQYQRGQLPGWWRIATTLYNFLFPVEEIGPGGGRR